MENCSLTISDFQKICRICMKFLDLDDVIALSKSLDAIIQCTSVQITEDDNKPQQLCRDCFQQVENAFALKQQCQLSDKIFRKVIEEQTPEIKEEDAALMDIKEEHSFADFTEENSDDELGKPLPLIVELVDIKKESNGEETSDTSESNNNNDNSQLQTTKESKVFVGSKYICNVCNETFGSKRKLILHKRSTPDHKKKPSEKTVVCETCGKSMRKAGLKRHITTVHQNVTYSCDLCPKVLVHKSSLKQHVERVHKNMPVKYGVLCNICGKGCKSAWKLESHLRMHTGEKPFPCEKCDKKYRHKAALKEHVERVHLDIRTHVCSICSRAFFDKRILNSHMTTHTGERPYQCKVCEQRFGQHAALWTHMKVHHSG